MGLCRFLEAIGNKKDEEHEEMLPWVDGSFDPKAFDATVATKALPDGRKIG
jgi:hypothetical protein